MDRGGVVPAIVKAAADMGLLAVVRNDRIDEKLAEVRKTIVPLLNQGETPVAASSPLVVIPDSEDVTNLRETLKKDHPTRIVAIRLDATPAVKDRVLELTHDGAEVIWIVFDAQGRESGTAEPRHVRDVLRDVHGALTKDGTRDRVTLVSSGGIALPEHMAKAIICGADLVAVDLPLLVALECRLCRECEEDRQCPVSLETADEEYARRRVTNLMGAWRNQLLELLGAMGIREVRRLRGETGRCMFFEDLEAQTFGRLFGKRKGANGA